MEWKEILLEKKELIVMNISKLFYGLSFSLFILTVVGLFIPQTVFGQAEKLGVVSYTPPKGWKKSQIGRASCRERVWRYV